MATDWVNAREHLVHGDKLEGRVPDRRDTYGGNMSMKLNIENK